jgi:hypothetical protein
MSVSTDIELRFVADMADLLRDLKATGKLSDETFAKAQKVAEKAYRAQKKAAKEAAQAAKEASLATQKGLAGLKALAEGMGGTIGGAAGMVEKFAVYAGSMATALGPAGVTAVAAAIGIAGVAVGAVAAAGAVLQLVTSADELIAKTSRLDGVFGALDADRAQSIHAVTDSIDALGEVASRAQVLLAGEFAAGMERGALVAVQLGLAVLDSRDRLGELLSTLASYGAVLGPLILGPSGWAGLQSAISLTANSIDLADKATASYADRARELVGTIRDEKTEEANRSKWAKASADARKEQADAEREYERAIRETIATIQRIQGAEESVAQLRTAAYSDLLSETDRVREATDAAALAGVEAWMAGADAALVNSAGVARVAQETRELAALQQQEAAKREQTLGELAKLEAAVAALPAQAMEAMVASVDAGLGHIQQAVGAFANVIGTFSDLRIQALEEEAEREIAIETRRIDRWREQQIEEIEGMRSRGELSDRLADREIANVEKAYKEKAKAAKKLGKDEEALARKSFRITQGVQIAAALIEGARAGVALIPSFAAVPFGLGVPAALSLGASTAAAQIALIRNADPPSFAAGGLVGDRAGLVAEEHSPILASSREGIVRADAMERLGRDGLDRINSGQSLSSSVSVYLDRRMVAHSVSDALTRDARVRGALDVRAGLSTGQVLVYGRG